MKERQVKFFGSKEDIQELREVLTKAGFTEVQDNLVRASESTVETIGQALSVSTIFTVTINGLFSIIKTLIQTRGKRMVQTVTPDGTKRTLSGNFTFKQFEKFVEVTAAIRIEDNKENTQIKRNAEGYITNAVELSYTELLNQRVLCPACNHPFERWPFGWDAHAASVEKCPNLESVEPKERKKEFKSRFQIMFRSTCGGGLSMKSKG